MSTETTPAIERAVEALRDRSDAYDPDELVATAVVRAALDLEAIARSIADDLYGQDVHTLVMRRPGESYRDQAERIGQWAAEIVLASVLGGAA